VGPDDLHLEDDGSPATPDDIIDVLADLSVPEALGEIGARLREPTKEHSRR
jgi:hypothetical protein